MPVHTLPEDPEFLAAVRHLGIVSATCVGDAMASDAEALRGGSVEIIQLLGAIWAARGIAPEEIWTELDHRLQLGEFLAHLQQDARNLPRRSKGAWHPSSTKLP